MSTESRAWLVLRSTTLGHADVLTPHLVEQALLAAVRADDSISLIDLTARGGVGFDVSLEHHDELVLQVSGGARDSIQRKRCSNCSRARSGLRTALLTLTLADDDGAQHRVDVQATVAAVNDAPNLNLAASPVHPAGSAGARSAPGFATFTAGPPDEIASQGWRATEVTVLSDPDGVLASAPGIDRDGTLAYELSGNSGVASLQAVAFDDGGRAGGGVDASAPRAFTVQVAAGADLRVAKDNGVARVVEGELTAWRIAVVNHGAAAAVGVAVQDVLPAMLTEGAWACVPAASTIACPDPDAGEGDLGVVLDLPAGAAIAFDVSARVRPGSGGTLSNTAAAHAPAADAAPGDNEATDSDPVWPRAVFRDGYETP